MKKTLIAVSVGLALSTASLGAFANPYNEIRDASTIVFNTEQQVVSTIEQNVIDTTSTVNSLVVEQQGLPNALSQAESSYRSATSSFNRSIWRYNAAKNALNDCLAAGGAGGSCYWEQRTFDGRVAARASSQARISERSLIWRDLRTRNDEIQGEIDSASLFATQSSDTFTTAQQNEGVGGTWEIAGSRVEAFHAERVRLDAIILQASDVWQATYLANGRDNSHPDVIAARVPFDEARNARTRFDGENNITTVASVSRDDTLFTKIETGDAALQTQLDALGSVTHPTTQALEDTQNDSIAANTTATSNNSGAITGNTTAITRIQTDISAEVDARSTADVALHSADLSLQNQIDAEELRSAGGDATLQFQRDNDLGAQISVDSTQDVAIGERVTTADFTADQQRQDSVVTALDEKLFGTDPVTTSVPTGSTISQQVLTQQVVVDWCGGYGGSPKYACNHREVDVWVTEQVPVFENVTTPGEVGAIGELQADLTAETDGRVADDAAIRRDVSNLSGQFAIDQDRQDLNLTHEANYRIVGDADLQAQRDSDLTAQGIIDSSQNAVSAAGDALLLNGITNNAGNIGANAANLTNETANRVAADAAQDVTNATDSARQDQRITNVNNRSNNADDALGQRITNVNNRSNAADDVQDAALTANATAISERVTTTDFTIDQQRQDAAIFRNEVGVNTVNDRVNHEVAGLRDADAGLQDNINTLSFDFGVDQDRQDVALRQEVIDRLTADATQDVAIFRNEVGINRTNDRINHEVAGLRDADANEAATRAQNDGRIVNWVRQDQARQDAAIFQNEVGINRTNDRINHEVSGLRDADADLHNRVDVNVSNINMNTANISAVDASSIARDNVLSGRITGNTTAIINESNARVSADRVLQANINTVDSNSVARDNVLGGRITGNTSLIVSESNARVSADRVLQSNINSVDANSVARDNALQSNIGSVDANSISRDRQLQGSINTVDSNSVARDQALQSNIGNVDTNSIKRDQQLQSSIGSVDKNSIGRDVQLQETIEDVELARIAADMAEAQARFQADLAEAKARIEAVKQEREARQLAVAKEAQDRYVADQEEATTRHESDVVLATAIDENQAQLVVVHEVNFRQDVDLDNLFQIAETHDAQLADHSNQLNSLRGEISRLDGGVAMGIATSALQFDLTHKGLQAAAGVGTFGGKQAIAIGFGGATNARTFLNLSVSADSHGSFGAGAGFTFKF